MYQEKYFPRTKRFPEDRGTQNPCPRGITRSECGVFSHVRMQLRIHAQTHTKLCGIEWSEKHRICSALIFSNLLQRRLIKRKFWKSVGRSSRKCKDWKYCLRWWLVLISCTKCFCESADLGFGVCSCGLKDTEMSKWILSCFTSVNCEFCSKNSSSIFSVCPWTKVTSHLFSSIWPFRPDKPNIFLKLMTPTIQWPTKHSPITLSDTQDLLSTIQCFNMKVYEHKCYIAQTRPD